MEWYYTGMYKYPSGNADAGADAVADADDNAGAGAGADADADDNASVGEGIKFSMIFQNLFAVFAPRVHVLSPTRRIRHMQTQLLSATTTVASLPSHVLTR